MFRHETPVPPAYVPLSATDPLVCQVCTPGSPCHSCVLMLRCCVMLFVFLSDLSCQNDTLTVCVDLQAAIARNIRVKRLYGSKTANFMFTLPGVVGALPQEWAPHERFCSAEHGYCVGEGPRAR